ncbi:MAG: hypothetical protein ACR2PI_04890 [Hyphomicrobiaceae bacterium]
MSLEMPAKLVDLANGPRCFLAVATANPVEAAPHRPLRLRNSALGLAHPSIRFAQPFAQSAGSFAQHLAGLSPFPARSVELAGGPAKLSCPTAQEFQADLGFLGRTGFDRCGRDRRTRNSHRYGCTCNKGGRDEGFGNLEHGLSPVG